ncbi:hypothetical protein CC1G_01967 [Coprinopsis cinerea okayama7|uniref:Asteroid domain-containing protein n=1 Tax=Coprinopsis cinerea (strain Okayama-7 / 130 / ATCC MYA-4618 / FGSC 9003) TaxID=240176 RepID=A8N649_COPC7|nr:hypothetical protein CC1G_01967 [Coprinopsis cinerea okayama7\|eukprot:XP_001830331.2 hypothetical protein CC1G_01967 [Coprinopsis cinerea okayama7\
MGVHGLTTYLREHRRALSSTVKLGSPSPDRVSIVVDGWSFIYAISTNNSSLPWVYGGEYHEFKRAAKAIVEAWLRVGLDIHFVFDGAYPDLKFPTLVTRLGQSHIQPGLLFFRTSVVSRSTPRSLAETWMLPPLSYSVCINALKEVQETTTFLHLHFADEEGDPYAVELAGRVGGYVVGNDSDFVILNSEGYLGYIPIDEMVWEAPSLEETPAVDDDDADFQIVRKPKFNRKPPVPMGIHPPETGDLKLHLTAYSPTKLSTHLNLPVTLLPLLGALVGNDFSSESETHRRRLQNLFFERTLSLTQRIDHAAAVVRSILTPSQNRRKAKHEVGSVMDLIDKTVNALMARHLTSMGSGEIEQIINGVVEATLQYAIPRTDPHDEPLWPTEICALHMPSTCSLLPIVSRRLLEQLRAVDEEDQALLEIRQALIHAYRKGSLSPKVMDSLNTSSSWPRPFLEHPDVENVNRSIGRPIRAWIYSILDDAVGLPDPPTAPEEDPTDSVQSDEEEEDPDELIDVVESDSEQEDVDYLAPLKGELNRLQGPEDESEATEPPPSITSSHPRERTSPAIVAEYIRRGTRVAAEDVEVPSLQSLLQSVDLEDFSEEGSAHLLLRQEDDRFTVLLRALKSDTPAVRALSPIELAPVLAVRWTALMLFQRSEETGSKERARERWAPIEARCWLATFHAAHTELPQLDLSSVTVADRNIQLMAQMLVALECIDQLAQVLFLEQRVPSPAHLLSGKRFHALLNNPDALVDLDDLDRLWAAVGEDFAPGVFQEQKTKKVKKKKGSSDAMPATNGYGRQKQYNSAGTRKAQNQSFFALLDSEAM